MEPCFFFRSRSQNNEVATARFGERAMGLLVVLECLALHVDLVPRFSGVEHGPAGLVEQHGARRGALYQLAFAVGPSAVNFLVRTGRRARRMPRRHGVAGRAGLPAGAGVEHHGVGRDDLAGSTE